jgi:poly(3-hydroxybutyrate) depolymerase
MTCRATYLGCTGLLAVASILPAAGVGLSADVAGAAAAPQARLVQASYTGAAGTLTYDVYVPASYVPGTPVPLVVAMHGCGQSAEVFRKLTHFDQLADAKNLIVVFPEQNSTTIDHEAAGEQAYKAMGAQKRVVPVIVVHGDQDKTVPLVNSEQVVAQWKVTDDWADNGARDDSVPVAPPGATPAAVPNGRSYTVARYSDGHGGELLQYWVVHGMGHAWSGGCSCERYSDPSGPDETGAMYDFFMSHPAP